ncbi:MAG: cation:proton antiporter [Candidatus Sericytochromatia bacterium]
MNDLTQLGEYLSHYPSLVIVLTTALIFLLGTIAQILSDKTSLPAIIFLLLFGSLLGKQGLNWINPDVYSSVGIRAIIAVAVAIVVFEGGLMIDFNHLRHHFVSVLGLITLNVLITILAMAWVTSQLLGIEWRIALMYAGLVSVTGPTVIAPILRRIHVSQKVKTILETEAVLVDAVGVIAAVSIFNYIIAGASHGPDAGLMPIVKNMLLSLVLGAATGSLCAWLARRTALIFSPMRGEVVRMLVLGTTVSAYLLGELVSHESGIASVAVAGMIIGNTPFPHKSSIKEFKGDLTLLSITVVFLLLSASLDLNLLKKIGLPGALCVLILMWVVRPVGVLLSTAFEKITWRERVFISWLGPRGIVAASAATFFSLEMDAYGIEGSGIIRGMVFMTVLITVIIEGAGAKYMASILDIAPSSVLIVGGGVVGKKLIEQLKTTQKEGIILIENDPRRLESLKKLSAEGVYLISADAREEKIYRDSLNQLKNITTLITTSEDDWLNLRVCQIVKKINPEVRLISVINDLKGRDVFENLGIQSIHLREAAATVIYVLMKTPSSEALPL